MGVSSGSSTAMTTPCCCCRRLRHWVRQREGRRGIVRSVSCRHGMTMIGNRHLIDERIKITVAQGMGSNEERAMEVGVYHEFHCRPDQTSAAAFAEALAQVEAADRWGLDAIWLAEIHQQARRSVLTAPLTVASAIAARTRRIKIGTGVQVLPLCHPLRLAEETATIDQISEGGLRFRVGRGGNPRSYVAYGVPYSESRERFLETLEILKRAWTQPSFSYKAKSHSFNAAPAVPRRYQQPHPPI